MSGCGLNRSYGSVSQSAKCSTGRSPASTCRSCSSACAAWLSRATASTSPSCRRAASAIPSASALGLDGARHRARCWPERGSGAEGREGRVMGPRILPDPGVKPGTKFLFLVPGSSASLAAVPTVHPMPHRIRSVSVVRSAVVAALLLAAGVAGAVAPPADVLADTVERHPLETRALTEPEAVLSELVPALRDARLADDHRQLALLY